MNEHICPKCQSQEVSWIGYFCPAQATCAKCNTHYTFGTGIRFLGLSDGIKARPSLYQQFLCPICKKYDIPKQNLPTHDALTPEDKQMICTCKTKEN